MNNNIDWKKIETELIYSCFVGLEFMVDGHTISIQKSLKKSGNFGYAVYIDGYIKGGWDEHNFPIIKKVWRKVDKYLYTKKRRDEAVKNLGKREAKKMGIFNRMVYYTPFFNTPKSLVRALKKIDNIELLNK